MSPPVRRIYATSMAGAWLAASCLVAGPPRVKIDAAYGDEAAQKLDLRTPDRKGFATVIFVHGGSLTSGDKADPDYAHVCDSFPGAGIGCATVNYRLGPVHPWPAQAEDVASAAAWVRATIESYGGDASKLFLLGHSSGAMLAALIGCDEACGLARSDAHGIDHVGRRTAGGNCAARARRCGAEVPARADQSNVRKSGNI